jgi:hypothetical protein
MPHSIPKDLLIANAPDRINLIPATGMVSDYWRSNYASSGEDGVEYVRTDLPTLATENALLRDALRWVAASSGCQASRIIAAAAVGGTDT